MEEIAKSDVFVPSDNAIAYGHFVSSSGKTCFKQAPSRNFLGTHDCKNQQNGGMVEYLKSGQLRIGRDCIYGNGKYKEPQIPETMLVIFSCCWSRFICTKVIRNRVILRF